MSAEILQVIFPTRTMLYTTISKPRSGSKVSQQQRRHRQQHFLTVLGLFTVTERKGCSKLNASSNRSLMSSASSSRSTRTKTLAKVHGALSKASDLHYLQLCNIQYRCQRCGKLASECSIVREVLEFADDCINKVCNRWLFLRKVDLERDLTTST